MSCPGPGAIAVFVYADWATLYPEFSNVTQPQATSQFAMAGIFLRNDGTGLVADPVIQTQLMYLMTAHLCFLAYGDSTGAGGSQLVGRISGATQGSVSVQTDMPSNPSNAWFNQSKYGAEFWQGTAAFRSGGRYRVGPGVYNGRGVGQGIPVGGAGFGGGAYPWLYPQGSS